MISRLFNPMSFGPTGAITPVDASAYLTPDQKAAMASKGGGQPQPGQQPGQPAAGGVPGQGGGAPMAPGAAPGGDSANIQSIMGYLQGGQQGGGGMMSAIQKILPFLGM